MKQMILSLMRVNFETIFKRNEHQITSASALVGVASSIQFGPVQYVWHIDSIMNNMACLVTSNLCIEEPLE